MPIQLRGYSAPTIPQPRDINPLGTIGGMLELASGYEYLKGQRADRQARQEEHDQQRRLASAYDQAQGDPHRAVSLLESAGDYSLARNMRGEINQMRAQQFEEQAAQYKAGQERLGLGTSVLQGLDGADDETVMNQWPAARHTLLSELGQELSPYARSIPDANAPTDQVRAFVDYAYPMGLEAGDALKRRERALGQTARDLGNARTQVELDEALAKGFAEIAPSLDANEWGPAVAELQGMSPRMMRAIGGYEDRAGLRERLGLKGPIAKPGSLEHEFNARAEELGIPVGNLDERTRHQIRRNFYASTRKPDAPKDADKPSVSHGSYSAALRWRRTEMAKLDRDDVMLTTPPEERELRRESINQDFYRQLRVPLPGSEAWSRVEKVLADEGYEPSEDNMVQFMMNAENRRALGLD